MSSYSVKWAEYNNTDFVHYLEYPYQSIPKELILIPYGKVNSTDYYSDTLNRIYLKMDTSNRILRFWTKINIWTVICP